MAADTVNWEHFKLKFITEDGRVVDDGNNNMSHSEGQGIGMLLADIGHSNVEEVNLGIQGANYGWSHSKEHLPSITVKFLSMRLKNLRLVYC